MKPWITGPKELLDHAEEHMKSTAAFDQRIALISIDNAVELAIKTYFGLPSRIRKCPGPSRKQLSETNNSFPNLLDLLEEFGCTKMQGIEPGDIEWYHRLRNTLYHDGNGITVDSSKVDSYFQIAQILMANLFEDYNSLDQHAPRSGIGHLILTWANLEKVITRLYYYENPMEQGRTRSAYKLLEWLSSSNTLSESAIKKLKQIRKLRNELAHGGAVRDDAALIDAIDTLRSTSRSLTGKFAL